MYHASLHLLLEKGLILVSLPRLCYEVCYFEGYKTDSVHIMLIELKLLLAVADLDDSDYLHFGVEHGHNDGVFKDSLLFPLLIVFILVLINEVVKVWVEAFVVFSVFLEEPFCTLLG